MKKVLFFTSSLRTGGAETLIKDYCVCLDKTQFEITVLVLDAFHNSIIEKQIMSSGVKLIYVDKRPSIINKICNKLFRTFRLKCFFCHHSFDIIHTHLQVNVFLRRSLNKNFQGKLFHTIHAPVSVSFQGNRKKEREKQAIFDLVNNRRMVLICLHQQMKKEADAIFLTDCSIVVPNAIDVKRFLDRRISQREARERIGIPTDCYLIGHIGRFSYAKNHAFLIDVYDHLRTIRDDAALLLVGDGELKKSVEQMVLSRHLEDKVFFFQPRSDIPEILSALDWFVFPSYYESFGISLLEAQVIGVPAITSSAIPSNVITSENVVTLDLTSADEWAKTIAKPARHLMREAKDFQQFDIHCVSKQLGMIYLT